MGTCRQCAGETCGYCLVPCLAARPRSGTASAGCGRHRSAAIPGAPPAAATIARGSRDGRSCSLAYYHAGGFSQQNLTTVSSAFLGRTASWIFLLAFDTSVAHYLGLVEKVGFDGGTGCHNRAATFIKAATLIIRNPVDQDRGAPSGLVGSPQAVGVARSP